MVDSDQGIGELNNKEEIRRVSVIVEYICRDKRYILLIKNTSEREFTEETGKSSSAFEIKEIDTREFNASQRMNLIYPKAKTPTGSNLTVLPVLARIHVENLPEQLNLSSEHSDFMFVRIPGWDRTQRHDFISMLRQFNSQKLVLARKHQGRVYNLRMTDEPYEIEGRERNISKISGIALTAYLQASFDNQI